MLPFATTSNWQLNKLKSLSKYPKTIFKLFPVIANRLCHICKRHYSAWKWLETLHLMEIRFFPGIRIWLNWTKGVNTQVTQVQINCYQSGLTVPQPDEVYMHVSSQNTRWAEARELLDLFAADCQADILMKA